MTPEELAEFDTPEKCEARMAALEPLMRSYRESAERANDRGSRRRDMESAAALAGKILLLAKRAKELRNAGPAESDP